MFEGVQVDIEGEGWMVRVVDKCYNCIYERDNLLDVIINYLFGILQVNNYWKLLWNRTVTCKSWAWDYFSVLNAGTQKIVFEQEHVYSSEK